MDDQEIRMRCIEAVASGGGVREPARLIQDAARLAEWVASVGEKAEAPRVGRPRNADKGSAPA